MALLPSAGPHTRAFASFGPRACPSLSLGGSVNGRAKFTTHSRVMFTNMIGWMFTTKRYEIKIWLLAMPPFFWRVGDRIHPE